MPSDVCLAPGPLATGAATPVPRTSGLAFTALVVAAFSYGLWFTTDMAAPLVAVIGLTLALFARRAIRRGDGRLAGRPLATLAVWLAAIHLVLTPVFLALGQQAV